MEELEYMHAPVQYFPMDIEKKYTLETIVTPKRFIYICIKKGTYGLKQAALLTYNNLIY